MCLDCLYKFRPKVSHSEKNPARYSHKGTCKVAVVLVRLQCNLNFVDRFSESAKISVVVKIRPFGAELYRAGLRTDIQT